MSGGLLFSFREGNRSELLADYLLSAIGITTPIRRQDDTGFDFYCQIADNQSGYLTFGFPFMIQIKSKEKNNKIIYGKKKKWKQEHLTWLFRNETPFLIGIVDKYNFSIEIYDTTGLWQVYNANSVSSSRIEMVPGKSNIGMHERKNCVITPIKNWPQGKGDGNNYTIDLGNPMISLNKDDILDTAVLQNRKNILRRIIEFEQQNILHRKQHVRAFAEIKNNLVNNSNFRTGTNFEGKPTDNVDDIYASIRDALIVQLFTLGAHGRVNEVFHLKELLKCIPYTWYYKEFLQNSPNNPMFDWIDPSKLV
jgi:hypothetical protein